MNIIVLSTHTHAILYCTLIQSSLYAHRKKNTEIDTENIFLLNKRHFLLAHSGYLHNVILRTAMCLYKLAQHMAYIPMLVTPRTCTAHNAHIKIKKKKLFYFNNTHMILCRAPAKQSQKNKSKEKKWNGIRFPPPQWTVRSCSP